MKRMTRWMRDAALAAVTAAALALPDPSQAQEKKAWVLSGTPLEQLSRTNMKFHIAYKAHPQEQVVYLPDCNIVNFKKDNRITDRLQLDEQSAAEFESYIREAWIANSKPQQEDFSEYNFIYENGNCGQLMVNTVNQFIYVKENKGIVYISTSPEETQAVKDLEKRLRDEQDRLRKDREDLQKKKREAEERQQKEEDKARRVEEKETPSERSISNENLWKSLRIGIAPSLLVQSLRFPKGKAQDMTQQRLEGILPAYENGSSYAYVQEMNPSEKAKFTGNAFLYLIFRQVMVGGSVLPYKTTYTKSYERRLVLGNPPINTYGWEEKISTKKMLFEADWIAIDLAKRNQNSKNFSTILNSTYFLYIGLLAGMTTYDISYRQTSGHLPEGYAFEGNTIHKDAFQFQGFNLGLEGWYLSKVSNMEKGWRLGVLIAINSNDEPSKSYIRGAGQLPSFETERRRWSDVYVYLQVFGEAPIITPK